MIAQSYRSMAALTACAVLAGCGDATDPPNHTIDGSVKGITRISPGCSGPKILVGIFGCGDPYYSIEITTNSSAVVKTSVGTARVNENDLRDILGQRITVKCYRKSDQSGSGCSQGLSSIAWNGRELIKP